MLAITGELSDAIGGPSVPLEKRETATRRNLYLFQKRGVPPNMQALFDGPSEASESCARRHTSTTALQSLFLLNNDFVLARSRKLAERLIREVGSDRRAQIETAFQWTLARLPDEDERQAAEQFFAALQSDDRESNSDQPTDKSNTDAQIPVVVPFSLVQFCQALFNLNEFVYLQ